MSSKYKPFILCGNPRYSVYIAGDLSNTTHNDIEAWLRTKISLSFFLHILKFSNNSYGHAHFNTEEKAGPFYPSMGDRAFQGPNGGVVYFNSSTALGVTTQYRAEAGHIAQQAEPGRAAQHAEVNHAQQAEAGHAVQQVDPTSVRRKKEYLPENRDGCTIFETGDTFTIVVSTPGVTQKDHVEIAVDGNDDNLIISGDVTGIFQNISGTVVMNNMPDKVENHVSLPTRIDSEGSIQTEVANGLTKITVNKIKMRPQKILKQKC
ncbi:hypothetical protein BC938DRAFT_475623 [Jimgerdemannia flammicorona]|uniref:SHSP domain-containing protein n=1 Tax=Jimgerdemannia flammicorona TaxID=994334 RepID=A0A433QRF5_9FUNG|nr:hypothetical protein BC938DRAFT_475623 [Jimgerdemannia flammicorona]